MFSIGIIGNGFVGKATTQLECDNLKLRIYDINPALCIPLGITLEDICKCNMIFISVPTPMKLDGSCHTKIVEDVVNNISKYIDLDKKHVVIRSTIPIGTCNKLNCYFFPEFLTEKNYMNDFRETNPWIFGLKSNDIQNNNFKSLITKILNTAKANNKIINSKCKFVSNNEAEAIKIFRNTFLATKVSFCNEFNEFCTKKGINYENVRNIATLDSRICSNHSFVPGPDGKFGFGGTCFPKDINSLKYQMDNIDMESFLIKAVIKRNEKVDRPEQDWKKDNGRAVIDK